ncbi:conserved hypothetical protein [uncultured Desulfovibrio sp.]|uniref:Uncharacterized protein n=1 Tax=uncultured Desulfovibrio sp. TaxID=167968 RepID=A0A212J8Y9_9BACT|nr:hypothetical protein [Desulfovibrio desulfuricans]MCB6542618.1 hypothetical protein [Desulfovibrio desulfuricans]MCB6553578.1 hypothetical protein [Desulfovibrio desulfuricans]MCB6565660.1 hypothetical protein [Desulfovibrio desulfuricans]MCB7346627.1 hypothetical protein [Desulfovibrio desulfuricans]MCQ4861387.1 hypothetical protein [Desulfovibrio desulfuricans]
MFPQYVAHSMEGRARLRHPALGEVAVRSAVQKTLGKEKDVLEVRPGSESMLLILKPGVDVASLCQRLEQSVPVLARPQAEVAAELRAEARARRGEQWRSQRGDSSAATRGFSSGSRGDKRNILGISQRKLEVRAMLGVAGVCLASGLSGPKPLHLLAGLAWALMASRHVWVRRKAV